MFRWFFALLLSIQGNCLSIAIPLPLNGLAATDTIHCPGQIGPLDVDWVVSCGFWDKLQLSDQEQLAGTVNLFDHLKDLLPAEGKTLAVVSYQNGIRTPLCQFILSCQAIAEQIPEGTLLIGLHNKTDGLPKDLWRLVKELTHVETPLLASTRYFLGKLAEKIHESSPQALWAHIAHSESGALLRRAREGMNTLHRRLLRQHLVVCALGPVLPIPSHFALHALNIYSEEDFAGLAGGLETLKTVFNTQDCNIEFIPCSTEWLDRTYLFVDHALLGGTYALALERQILRWRQKYGFFDALKAKDL